MMRIDAGSRTSCIDGEAASSNASWADSGTVKSAADANAKTIDPAENFALVIAISNRAARKLDCNFYKLSPS
jgi:hypothetical protein